MKRTSQQLLLGAILFCAMNIAIFAQEMRARIDFKNIKDDKVHVTINVPKIQSDEILYIMPASIPGTYAKMDFGYFVKNFKASDAKGGFIPVRR